MGQLTPEMVTLTRPVRATLVGNDKTTLLYIRSFDLQHLHGVYAQQPIWLTVTEHQEVYLHRVNEDSNLERLSLIDYAAMVGVEVDEFEAILTELWRSLKLSQLTAVMLPIMAYTEPYP